MYEIGLVLLGGFALGLILGVPIYLSLGMSAIGAIVLFDLEPLHVIPNIVKNSISSFTLIAIPLFIVAGNILAATQIGPRLIELARTVIADVRGGLPIVSVIVGLLFAAISGSGPADVPAQGAPQIPAMEKAGYPHAFASALIAANGTLGLIFPPSLGLIMYGVIARVSIAELFIAGVLPGILVAFCIGCAAVLQSHLRGWGKAPVPLSDDAPVVAANDRSNRYLCRVAGASRRAVWGLGAPLLVIGGLYGGIFTPTEVGAAVVFYSFFVAILIYKDLGRNDILSILVKSCHTTGIIMIIVASASIFSYVLTTQGLGDMVADVISYGVSSPFAFLILINIILLIAGAFIDGISITFIMAPILAPIAVSMGIDPVHFGMIFMVNIALGQITPPVGINLFVACSVGRVTLSEISSQVPFIFLFYLLALLIITYVPAVSTMLPELFFN